MFTILQTPLVFSTSLQKHRFYGVACSSYPEHEVEGISIPYTAFIYFSCDCVPRLEECSRSQQSPKPHAYWISSSGSVLAKSSELPPGCRKKRDPKGSRAGRQRVTFVPGPCSGGPKPALRWQGRAGWVMPRQLAKHQIKEVWDRCSSVWLSHHLKFF